MVLMDWLEESDTDVGPIEWAADLTFVAIQTRSDVSLEAISPDWPFLVSNTASLLKEI